MRAGELRHRITIRRISGTIENEAGELIPSYADFKTVWAAVEPLRGREYLEAQKINEELSYLIKIRFIEGITPDMVIKFKGRIFEIQNILNIGERKRELHLMCIEKVN